ncbi:hypothetical protein [Azohydromonas sediminis]|uniref:hypothetical protein n=1 Tax=Azohydromonas sediminis TaxID=2259674 RepID=UPI001F24CC5A|nr:hypothetical protein [Azohydromonas sediminis]
MWPHDGPVFEREMGCTADELRGWLPAACRGAALAWRDGGVDVTLGAGRLRLDWRVLPPRRIALVVLPRLVVRFAFEGVGDEERRRFMHHFDLYTQRGGG